MLGRIELRFGQQQVAFWEVVGCHQSEVTCQGERNMDNRLVFDLILANVNWNKGHPNHTVDQGGKSDVPCKVVLMKRLYCHESAHE